MKGLFARFTGAEDERPAVKAARLRAELAQLELSVLQDGSPETETAAVVHDDQPQTPLPPRRDVLGPLRRLHGNRLPARPEAQRIAETSSVIAPSSRSEDTNGDDDLLVNDESVKEQNAPPSGWMGRVVQAMTSTVRVDDDVAEFKSESERLAGPRGSSAEERHSREMDDDPAYNALMAAHQGDDDDGQGLEGGFPIWVYCAGCAFAVFITTVAVSVKEKWDLSHSDDRAP